MRKNKTILAITLGALLASNAYAAGGIEPKTNVPDKATGQSTPINNKDLSTIALEQKKLERESDVAKTKLDLLKTNLEIQKIQDEQEGGSSSTSGNNVLKMSATEEQRLAEEQGLNQDVGFVYKGDSKKTKLTKENSEIDTVLKEFNELKKKVDTSNSDKDAQEAAKFARPQISIKSLESVQLDRLSIYNESEKSARIKFIYLVNEGQTQKRVSTPVDVKEGAIFKVQGDSYKVMQIGNNGVTIQNTISKKDIELNRVE